MKKIITILGARPQFIKASTISHEIARTDGISETLLHTGQHFDENMSDVFFDELNIPKPAYNLGVSGGRHGQMTGRQLEKIETVLLDEKPDAVLVYGDTNSTMAGALAAAQNQIPIAHVEAGLRSFNRAMPEEINRVMTDHLSNWLFAPTQLAVDNLKTEGIAGARVTNCGDVMYDAALHYADIAREKSAILTDLDLTEGHFRLATLHRPANTDSVENLRAIFTAFQELAREMPLVLPLHPRTRNALNVAGLFDQLTAGLTLTDPLGFLDIIRLMQSAKLVLTDSGGVQKEAYFHATPVSILRDETEWVELLDMGWAELVDVRDPANITSSAARLENQTGDSLQKPYGDGSATRQIVQTLLSEL
ncbi:UDP-N-acetyl glucosamine 2-epimerase [Amylibacter marinus]|uniref:UDP-N-acetyl glucosamine 2-epimerase n=1 Tax=Amylibacter marinus TaxID=1475483 RepID=A0ABQ5VXL6_9RHOB|nr:UDP-N-acetylglucosamine 2-epimerase (non-hydrolyzing) [Amylibacter marinus]GLQ35957.1 UDP-N-acetyl glucosamine 2-epimerase [Amylibacter marinus]